MVLGTVDNGHSRLEGHFTDTSFQSKKILSSVFFLTSNMGHKICTAEKKALKVLKRLQLIFVHLTKKSIFN